MTGTPALTAFLGHRRLASGGPADVAAAMAGHPGASVIVFDDETGRQVDLDLRGGPEAAAAEYLSRSPAREPAGRGRPKLGVVPREVTLLPRHWDWLAAQPGGASAALRRLVDQARKVEAADGKARAEIVYRAMSVLGGDLPDFEEASRALFAGDAAAFAARTAAWPADVTTYLARLAAG